MSNSWLRLWHDMPTDPKWRTIAKVSGQRIGDVIAVYTHMLVCASNASERGRTQGWSDEDVASALDLEEAQVSAIRGAMQGRVLEGDALKGWDKRQPKREDGAAERAKQWREDRKNGSERSRTQPNADKRSDTDTDTDTDTEKTPLPPSGAEAPAVPAVPAKPVGKYHDQVVEVFEHWKVVCGHPLAQLGNSDSKRYKAVAKRIADGYTVDQLKQAVDGVVRTEHNMGYSKDNPGAIYDDLELICRDAGQVDRFMRKAASGAPVLPPANSKRSTAVTHDAGKDYGTL